ncbi:MAG: LamG domain-containing protein [Pirellulaceae bacterium]|nr:LamG domain-containing protein [Pirellulaceae bacterium]
MSLNSNSRPWQVNRAECNGRSDESIASANDFVPGTSPVQQTGNLELCLMGSLVLGLGVIIAGITWIQASTLTKFQSTEHSYSTAVTLVAQPSPQAPDQAVDSELAAAVAPDTMQPVANVAGVAAGKLPVPQQAEQTVAMKLVRDVYESAYADAKTSEQKAALATELLTAAKDPAHKPPQQFALLIAASNLALQASNCKATMTTIDALDDRFVVDAFAMKRSAAEQWAKLPLAKQQRLEIAKALVPVAKSAVAIERYDVAVELLKLARSSAIRGRDVSLVRRIETQSRETVALKKLFAAKQAADSALVTDPTDESANETVGRYQCFVRGDWSGGLPHLAKSSHPFLQDLAERDLVDSADPVEQLSLGDRWYDVGKAESGFASNAMMRRARYWYELAQPKLTGLSQTKCEKRLTEIDQILSQPAAGFSTPEHRRSGLVFDGKSWLETTLKYDGKTPLTIETWVSTDAAVEQSIVANCHGVGLALQITSEGRWGFHIRDKSTYQGAVSDDKVQLGQRVHLAGVTDGRNIALYVNGKRQKQLGHMTSGHKVSNFRFMIGADPDFHSKPQKHFRGTIDSVHVARTALYGDDFTPRDPPRRTPSTVLLLQLDENEGAIARDHSVFQQHVRIHGAVWK